MKIQKKIERGGGRGRGRGVGVPIRGWGGGGSKVWGRWGYGGCKPRIKGK